MRQRPVYPRAAQAVFDYGAEPDAARADALLLERVDSSLSRSVPEPMEPLLTLVSWNSNREEQKTQAKNP